MGDDETRVPPIGRRRRRLGAAAVAIVSVYAVYLIAINVFLSTSLFQSVLGQDRETIAIDFARGWSLFPGRIHAQHLSLRSSDSNVEWILKIDDVVFDVSFVGLAQRRFEASRVHGRGVSMRARQKLDAWPSDADVANLAPVDGFPAFSVRPAGPPHPQRWDDTQYRLWTVRLEGVVAEDVREVWIDSARFRGEAKIAGRFYLKPIRGVEIGPAHVAIASGAVTAGAATPVVKRIDGTADVELAHFDPRTLTGDGAAVLRYLSATTDLRAATVERDFFPSPSLLRGELDARRIALRIDHGRLRAGSRIEVGAPRAVLTQAASISTARLDLVAAVADEQGGERLRGTLQATELAIAYGGTVPNVTAPRAAVRFDASALDLANEPLRDAHAIIDLPEASLEDARILNGYILERSPVRFVAGSARVTAQAELWRAEKRATASGNLHGEGLDLSVAKLRIGGSFDAKGSVGSFRWDERVAEDVRVDMAVAHAVMSSEKAPASPIAVAPRLEVTARAARVDVADPLRSVEASFRMRDAAIADLGLLSGYLPAGYKMRLVERQARFSLTGDLTIEEHLARGTLAAHSNALGLRFDTPGLEDVRVRAEIDARAKVHDWRWEAGDLAIDAAQIDLVGVRFARRRSTIATVERIRVGARSAGFTFADPLARVDLTAKIDGAIVHDAVALDAFMPEGATYGLATNGHGTNGHAANGGSFEAECAFTIARHVARGRASARASSMGIRVGETSVSGDPAVSLAIEKWRMGEARMKLGESRLTISNVSARLANGKDAGLSARRITLVGSTTDLDLARPDLRAAEARLQLEGLELADARALQVLLPSGAGGSTFRIQSGRASVSGDVAISASRKTGVGSVVVDVARGGVAIARTQLVGDYKVTAKVSGFDPETMRFGLEGSTVAMREVQVSNASAEAGRWSGDLVLDRGGFAFTDGGPEVDVGVRLAADDARPLLGVLLGDSVPKFLVGIVDMPRLSASADMHIGPSTFVVSNLVARGGDVGVRGTVGLLGDERRGAFIVSKGPLSVGVRIDEDSAHPRFFGLDAWLKGQEQDVATAREQAKAKGRR